MRIAPIRMNYLNPVSFRSNKSKTAENETLHFTKTKKFNHIAYEEEKDGTVAHCEITVPKRMGDYGNIIYEVSKDTPSETENRDTYVSWAFRSMLPGVSVMGFDEKEDLEGVIDTLKKITSNASFKEQCKHDWSADALCAQLDTVSFNLKKQVQKKD